MILIKHIEFIQTDRDPYEIISQLAPYEAVEVLSNRGDVVVPVSQITELIRGRRFVRPSDNTDIVVGLSKQAGDILGIQYEAWEAMELDLESYRIYASTLRREMDRIKNIPFWTRLKWLFTGWHPNKVEA